jgi:hypothetical protein
MRSIPAALQTVYLDLLQQALPRAPGTVWRQRHKGKQYLKVDERHGSIRITRHLGPADDPEVQQHAGALRAEAHQAKNNRKLVSALKRAGVPSPPQNIGRVLEVLANAHIFESGGVVLVGTAAYICYSAGLGFFLPSDLMTTQDVDLSVISLAMQNADPINLSEVLKRADPTFQPMFHLAHPTAPPAKFKSESGLLVDLLIQLRRSASPVPLPALGAAAEALPYQDYLVEDRERAIALYGSGVPVLTPRPSRFGVHKLIISSLRQEGSAKRAKDLMQAQAVREALLARDPGAWDEAIDDARGRGKKWKQLVDKGLRALACS